MSNQIPSSHQTSDQKLNTLILVPQGAEYQAVVKGLKHYLNPQQILPIPIGCVAVGKYLETLTNPQQFTQVILMGLCGSLNPNLKVGDIVVYAQCFDLSSGNILECEFKPKISNKFTVVKSVTSDRLIYLAAEKQNLYKDTNADVVDMEGFAVVNFFRKLNIPVGMIRVVSDDSGHDLPNLEQAIDQNGNLKPWQLAIALIKQPHAALRLISGSLMSLRVLSQICLINSLIS
ncbi:nucleoside phosphorylase [Synechococcus sp. PCC 7502]|uniref:phosphorylase family protein n=1 Tax=Synechococcus sp. PCC 7502 TaxID=1173263 RepID=UPI00029FE70A|nr:nucleoside phosphorylase [Synechococcus sp. PCC 7502]AFY72685.1 nucleoside phosphorylase [Synechococcus sp. PCC 7502]